MDVPRRDPDWECGDRQAAWAIFIEADRKGPHHSHQLVAIMEWPSDRCLVCPTTEDLVRLRDALIRAFPFDVMCGDCMKTTPVDV